MHLRADFSRAVEVAPEDHTWVPSPLPGIERMMLDRIGQEQARATSLVRYAAGSGYAAHAHPKGEEILVLEGTFSEGELHHPAGCYLRNPPGSSHQPDSPDGALIFVKLAQMSDADCQHVRVDTRDPANWQQRNGQQVCPLYEQGSERVCMVRLAADEPLFTQAVAGAEALVVSGHLHGLERALRVHGWLRLPAGSYPAIRAGALGATVFLKTGPLAQTGKDGA